MGTWVEQVTLSNITLMHGFIFNSFNFLWPDVR